MRHVYIITKYSDDKFLKLLKKEKIQIIYAFTTDDKISIKINKPNDDTIQRIKKFDWIEEIYE